MEIFPSPDETAPAHVRQGRVYLAHHTPRVDQISPRSSRAVVIEWCWGEGTKVMQRGSWRLLLTVDWPPRQAW